MEDIVKKFWNDYQISAEYSINNNEVDVFGDINIHDKQIEKVPFQFGTIYGDFKWLSNNTTTLKGFPKIITGSFTLFDDILSTLEFGPIKTRGYYIGANNLPTTKYVAKDIGGLNSN